MWSFRGVSSTLENGSDGGPSHVAFRDNGVPVRGSGGLFLRHSGTAFVSVLSARRVVVERVIIVSDFARGCQLRGLGEKFTLGGLGSAGGSVNMEGTSTSGQLLFKYGESIFFIAVWAFSGLSKRG